MANISHFGAGNSTGQDMANADGSSWSPPPMWLLCFSICLCVIILVGIVGNFSVIFVLIKSVFLRTGHCTTIDVYIFNLSVADFLYVIFCVPFQGTVYIFNGWPYGWLMCKGAHYCQYLSMFASIWILSLMSVDRYLCIAYPLKSVNWRTLERAARYSFFIWLASAVVSSPWLFLYTTVPGNETNNSNTACFDMWPDTAYDYRKWWILFIVIVGFILPCHIIFCTVVLVGRAIRRSATEPLLAFYGQLKDRQDRVSVDSQCIPKCQQRRRKRVVWLVFALALVHLVCWLPHNIAIMWTSFDMNSYEWINEHLKTFYVMKLMSHICTYVHSSINPVLYSLCSRQFRTRLLHAMCSRRSNPSLSSGYSVNRQSFSQL